MVLGILQFQVLVHGAESLKDKRRVVQSLKDRLHREHLCAIAEVGDPDLLNVATIALAVVAREGQRAGEVLDAITVKLRELRDGEIGEIDRQILQGSGGWLPGELPEPDQVPAPDKSAVKSPVALADPKSGDGSDEVVDAMILERGLDADLLDQIDRADRELRSSLRGPGNENPSRKGGDAA